MATLLGGRIPVVVAVLVLALLKANGEESTSLSPGIQVHHDAAADNVVVTQKNGQLLLNCSVTSENGKLVYKWFKDNKIIEFDEVSSKIRLFSNGSLYIKKVRKRKRKSKTDEGVYTCKVTDGVGSLIAKHVRVQVANVAKTFLQEPQSQVAYAGGSARFECAIKAFPPAVYVWSKNDKALPQDDHRYTQLPSGVLHINNLEKKDTGSYRCITSQGGLATLPDVVDSLPLRRSKPGNLTINQIEGRRKPRYIRGNQNVTAKVRETAILECLFDGSPLPNVTWTRADLKPLNSKLSYIGRKNLKIRSVNRDDAGVYYCTGSSRGFNDEKISVNLQVLEPPVIKKAPVSQRWPKARVVIFNCEVEAVPEAKIRWFHNGVELEARQPYEFQLTSLVIYNVELKHAGYYQCVAENIVGRTSALARLEIWKNKWSPEPPKGLKAVAVSSKKIFIQWNKSISPSDFPIITYVVSIMNRDEGEGDRSDEFVHGSEDVFNITQDSLNPYTKYDIFVKAFNKKGASEKSDVITVVTMEDKPKSGPEITLTAHSPDTIRVEWKEMLSSQSAGVITEYKVYYRTKIGSMQHNGEHVEIIEANKNSYNIRGLEPDQEYEVRVLASTKLGYPELTDDQWPWVPITTPKLTSSFPTPHLNWLRKNSSTVVIGWKTVDTEDKVLSYDIILRNLQANTTIKRLSIEPPDSNYTFHNLENGTLYEVTILAKGDQDSSGPVAMEFRTTVNQTPVPAENLHSDTINSNTILLTWSQHGPARNIISYDVCYNLEAGVIKTPHCVISATPDIRISDLKPYTRYRFTVKTHFKNSADQVSRPLITQTREDIPSAPTNITYIVVSPGTVELHWKPPVTPNGVITSYIIFYNNNKQHPDTMWRNVTQTGGLTQATVEQLTAASYFFKLSACTKAGQGRPSQMIVVYPTCDDIHKDPCIRRPPPGPQTGPPGDKQLGIIVGVTIGIICIVICIIVIVFRNRCFRTRTPQYDAPTTFHGNGHIPGHGNGHAVHVNSANRLSSVPSADLDAMTPMLTSLPENAESDSKGGGTLIVTPNGVRVNGLSRSFQNGHVPNGHVTRLEGSAHLNDSGSSEEHRGLIAAMLASTDCSMGVEGSEMVAITGASLEEIDGSLEGDGQINTAPVTAAAADAEAATAAMLKVTGNPEDGPSQIRGYHHPTSRGAPAAAVPAAESPSLRNNSGGSGNAADSSTSSHLPRSKPASGRDKGQGHRDRPPTPPLPLSSSIPGSNVCSSQESPVAPGTHIDSLPRAVGAGQLPHMYVHDGTRLQQGLEQPDSSVV